MIIGLLGPAGAGKSTVAEYLHRRYGTKTYTLAKPLKQLVKSAFDLSIEQVYGTQEQKETVDPRYNVTPRWLLQRIGTQGFRGTFGEDFWIDYTLNLIKKENPTIAVIDDVRFLNEATGLQVVRAQIWRLENEALPPTGTHQSEVEWKKCPFDYKIVHDGYDMDALYALVDSICRGINITPVSLV